ncbi:MAG: MBL fold metallo-hydrolase [Planctomycetes bacterium]|nr:MBL fold metallo-hydrolase [Planctomycetota bacterium]
MALTYTVVSIGTLSRNRFWGESEPRRVAHATTTLIRDGDTTILVDPGLPGELLAQRLDERTGLKPEQIDLVFLTNFRPVHRRALGLFAGAGWLMHGPEIEAVRGHLENLSASLSFDPEAVDARHADQSHPAAEHAASEQRDLEALVRQERGLLDRIKSADDRLSRRVHLFPSVGATPGSAALLLTDTARTVLVAGDAVVSRDYFEVGRVFEQVYDLQAAQAALQDVMEVADVIVPGHDNLFMVAGW